ncbi:MAG: GAF domain-containing sensor histidine kinase [Thermoleophilia bacterium]|nr:GAF domain-containing sensor histidine kinase [Thermoleophilia bacterium]
MQVTQDRTRALVEAGIALTSELSLDAVLQKLVETAAALTDARYAALGVLDPSGHRLERFITTGVDEETRRTIGELPHGRGILGVLIREAKPLRLHDLTDDPRSVGFPPGHPPMRTFLGVPLSLRGVAYGNLYLTEKEGGLDFTEEDEDTVVMLAAQAAVAIENARLYESATRWSAQLEYLNEVTSPLVTEFDLAKLLQIVVSRVRELIGARAVTLALPHGDGARIEAMAGEHSEAHIGMLLPARSKTMRVLARKRSERVDSVLDDPEIDQEAARRLELNTALYVPLVLREQAIGVIGVHDKLGPDPRFTDDDLRIAEIFAARAAVAVDLSQRVARDALQRVVTAQELERRRLARELHDETGQALTSILLGLRRIEEARSAEEMRNAVAEVRDLVRSTLQDVRQLAVELRPKTLDDFGLVPAVERLVQSLGEQTGLSIQFEAAVPEGRLPAEVETALYRIVQEALTNVVKHARATAVSVVLTRKDDSVSVVVEDDGVGFEPERTRDGGLGLVGMRERVGLLGGRLRIESSPGAGSTLVVEVPLP